MGWSTPTSQNVLDEGLSPGEAAALAKLANSPAQIGSMLSRAVNEARDNIQAAGNDCDVAGTIPDQVLPHVLNLVIYRLLNSAAGARGLLTTERVEANKAALEYFAKVASGQIKIVRPVIPIATTGPVLQIPNIGLGRLRCGLNEWGQA